MNNDRVSVIITTRNEEANISRCLESIRSQTYPKEKIEIIIVDNDSTDKTAQIGRRYTDKVYNYGPERSAQRNLGIKNAEGEYALYLDADMILSEQVIAESLKKCEGEGYIGLYIPERIIGNGFWVKVRDFERSFYNATVIDCVRFLRRDKFLEIGGFDESLTGPEDWDFDRRMRGVGRVGIINPPIYHNEGHFSLKKYLEKKIYYARWLDTYMEKWGRDDPEIKKQLGFRYRYFGVFLEKGKWKKFLRHPLLVLGIYILRVSVGLAYLIQKCKG